MRFLKRLPGCLVLALLLFACAAGEETCAHEALSERIVAADGCRGIETVEVFCADCGYSLETKERAIPVSHAYGEWLSYSAATCQAPEIWGRVCTRCGEVESKAVGQPTPHDWGKTTTIREADCETSGLAYADCRSCGVRQEITLPALGHDRVEHAITEPTPEQPGHVEVTCARCGALLESREEYYRQMLYDNAITALGPSTRDLIGGLEWYRITPLDVTKDGTFTYPLVASDRYTVGNMTVVLDGGILTVSYKFNSSQFRVNSESLMIYPDLETLRAPVQPSFFELDTPIDIRAYFGGADVVLLSLLIRADFDAAGTGVGLFAEDEAQIAAMRRMIQ